MKKLMMLGLVAGAAAGLTGCFNKEESDTIVVYSNAINAGYNDKAIEEAKEAGFNIEIVHDGGLALSNKMILEKDAPVADVIFGPTVKDMIRLEDEGVLGEFNPSWADEIPTDMKSDGDYYSLTIQPMLLVYNKDRVDANTQMPTGWEDLTQSGDFNDMYTMWNSGGATASTLYSSYLMDYKATSDTPSDEQKYGITNEGWTKMQNFIDNGHANTPGTTEVMDYLKDEDKDYIFAQLWGAGVTDYGQQHNIEFGVANVHSDWTEDTPVVNEVLAVSNKKRSDEKEENVQAFAEWLGTSEFMVEWANTIGCAPASSEIQGEVTGDGSVALLDIIENINAKELDLNLWVEQSDNWGAEVISMGYEA